MKLSRRQALAAMGLCATGAPKVAATMVTGLDYGVGPDVTVYAVFSDGYFDAARYAFRERVNGYLITGEIS